MYNKKTLLLDFAKNKMDQNVSIFLLYVEGSFLKDQDSFSFLIEFH